MGRTQGSSFLATLIVAPKLSMVGEECLHELSPQSIVNNFARRATDFCEQFCRRPKKARGHAALDDEYATRLVRRVSPEFRSSAALGLKTNTQMPTARCLTIRPSLSPSQRVRNTNRTQP